MQKLFLTIKENLLLQCILINLILLTAFLLIFNPYLENQADIIMEDLICGNYAAGIPTDAVLFSNFMIAGLLIRLKALIPAAPWYMIFQWGCCFFALTVIGTLTFKGCKGFAGRYLTIGVLTYLSYECYVLPGYLKTATVLAVASVYLILVLIIGGAEHKKTYCALAVISGILSSLTAFFVFVVIFAVCTILSLIYIILERPFSDKRSLIKGLITGAVIAAAIFILGAGLYYADRLHYFRSPELSASIAYRLGYEKCLSYGVPYFKFREDELEAAKDAIYRLGALDPDLVDTNERLLYMAGARLMPTIYEVKNFLMFEPENILRVPFIYLWGFLAYILIRYGGRKGRITAAVSAVSGILILFVMRQFLCLGYYRMYTLELMAAVYFLLLFFGDISYHPEAAADDRQARLMFAFDVVMVCLISFYMFRDDFPVSKDAVHETEVLYLEDDSTSRGDEDI